MIRNIIIVPLTILFLIVSSNASYSQHNYLATYKVYYKPINFDSIRKKMNRKNFDGSSIIDELKSGTEYLKKIRFNLEFNKDQSIFFKLPMLEDEARNVNLIAIVLGINNSKYYTNSKSTVNEKNSFGRDFLVEVPKTKWNITNSYKKIGKYTCYKANAKKNRKNSRGSFEQDVIAWFCPELPFNFGPKEYSGLPGLIVELQEHDNLIYQLLNIKKKDRKEITFPTKGKRITLKEFEALSKKMLEELKSNR